MTKTVGNGKYTYEVDEHWAQLPIGIDMPAAAVAVDSQDRVFCYNRSADHPIIVFDREGHYLYSWGEGLFAFPHAIFIDLDDNVWLVDRDHGQVMKFTTLGEPLMTIGIKGYRSDTGADVTVFGSDGYKQVTHGGAPFNMPAGIAVAPSGEIFVADGYANCRIHKFSSNGKFVLSWGDPGTGPGQFMLPHGVWIDTRGRVLVADRENNRVQAFTQDGHFLSIWPTELIGPAVIYVDDEDTVYIPEHNGGMFSVLNLDGEQMTQWGSANNRSCHGAWVDSHRDLYVVQPMEGQGSQSRTVVKFHRRS